MSLPEARQIWEKLRHACDNENYVHAYDNENYLH